MARDPSDPVQVSIDLLSAIATVGRDNPARPEAVLIDVFRPFFIRDKTLLDESRLDDRDGGVTRREALLRFLLLSAVVDQGPDIEGVRDLVVGVVNDLYEREVRIFHRPLDFFEHFGNSVDSIETIHEVIKQALAPGWAKRNNSTPNKYLLYAENARQTLGYAIYRWGAPLALSHLLQESALNSGHDPSVALFQYLQNQHDEFAASTEGMTRRIKDHRKYGLGKAIGDKAAHLFGKWVIHAYPLLRQDDDPAWDPWSYEVPFDSNAGRVLYRTGFITTWIDDATLRKKAVLQTGGGKQAGTDYMRVTNLRGINSARASIDPFLVDRNKALCVDHLRSHKRGPTKIEIQRLPSVISLRDKKRFTPGQIDDGLIKIGTTWCLNTATPDCENCPIRNHCAGANTKRDLILKVRT